MPTSFTVANVAVIREDWGWVVVLGSVEEMDGQPYLILQRADEFSADDVRLGQDQPYIEICDQGRSWYGNIEQIELHPTKIEFQMSATATQLMGNDGHFIFGFHLPSATFTELESAIARIFDGFTCYARAGA